jgi:hypothetical protein
MPDTKTEPKKDKGSKFFQKHKTPILIVSAVAALIVVYIYVKSKNASATTASTNVVPANTPANTGGISGYGEYNGAGPQGVAGPAGVQGPEGPGGSPGVTVTSVGTPITSTPTLTSEQALNGVVANSIAAVAGVQVASVLAPKSAAKAATGSINAPAWKALTESKKPVVSKIGTQLTVNPQGGNGRIITLPNFPSPPKPGPKPHAVKQPVAKNLTQAKIIEANQGKLPAAHAKVAKPPAKAPAPKTLTESKVTAAAYAGRK